MDSQLMNVFQEDPFEGNFVKYETEPNFWSPNDDLQLTDTLNGILPIAPTDESLLNHSREEDLQNRRNMLMYSEFVEQQLSDQNGSQLSAQVYQAMDDSEVDVYDQQRQLSAIVEYDVIESEDEDARSQCSVSTFRTRTDSSSIGDYESHSSDYEDEVDDDIVEDDFKSSKGDQTAPLQSFEDRKNRTLSTNTITSEVDAFGLNIDVNNFDLADFITKDDFAENLNACRMKQTTVPKKSAVQAKAIVAPSAQQHSTSVTTMSLDSDTEDDSDSIIDVETIDVVDVDESVWADQAATAGDDLCYTDNVKADPSWCPKATKKPTPIAKELQHKSPEVEPAVAPAAPVTKPKTANICLVPSKKQCDFLKRKVGVTTTTSKASKAATKKVQDALKSTSIKPVVKPVKATGLGLGGKNLALLKQQREGAASQDAVKESPSPAPTTVLIPLPVPAPVPKRKLNLEEYKQRRCGGDSIPKSKPTPPKQPKLDAGSKVLPPVTIEKPSLPPSPQKTAIAKIVNSLKCPSKVADAVPMDPITVAKNKVLRMLEMKRAQQLKIIDSRVSAKVPRVTKLPPLKDLVKGTYCMEVEPADTPITAPNNKLHPDYEEIIIVSVGSNTDITIPPNQMSKVSPRSLLKSSVLLYNISNGHDAATNMNNSLLASIQSELVKQTGSTILPTFASKPDPVKNPVDKNAQHGEDMIIMHLPKDRVRKTLVTMETQTDFQPEFPVLALPKSELTARKSRERVKRKYRKRRNDTASGSNGSGSSSGSSSDCSSLDSYRSRSRSNSVERLRNLEASAVGEGSSIGNCGYSSRSTQRHRSSVSSSSYSEAGERRQRRTSYNKRRAKNQKPSKFSSSGSENSDHEGGRSLSPHHSLQPKSDPRFPNEVCQNNNNNRRGFMDRNVSQPAVEERRIVYVGRIEQETTKEMLRRKFLPYGSIKQITLHYKENGMKYGFVTYEKAQDAFTAIDTSPRDSQINMYDISFGGRRAFCRATYADLDNAGINTYDSYVYPKEAPAPKVREDSFEALLLSVKAKLNSGKAATPAGPAEAQPVPPFVPQDEHRM